MQKGLLRQLKRTVGIADEAQLNALLSQLPELAAVSSPEVRSLLEGFAALLERVDGSYAQYERDLELRTRSLELSSAELSGANDQLRHELASREEALRALRETLADLHTDSGKSQYIEEDISALSRRIGELVAESRKGRRELANQKFALDQHAIVSITDCSGKIVYANDRFCAISGYTQEELLGGTHRIVNSGVHPTSFFTDMWQTICSGEVWQGEICNRAKNGRAYWVNASIVPLLDADGLPTQYIGIRTDITDRKQMEAQISEQLQLVEALIETIPLPLYLKDTTGHYLRINRAFEIFFGVDRTKLIGHTIRELMSAEDAALHIERDHELLARGGTQTYEVTLNLNDGTQHDAIYRKALLRRADGSVIGLLGTVIDITERKRAEAELLLAKDAAESASRAKSEFLANMSHEIRTPMNGVIGMTELALDTALTEEQRDYLNIIKSSGESLLTIINDILDFSKIEAGKLLVESISFDLHRVIAETLKNLALRAHEKNLELVSEILPDVPVNVLGDPNRIRQVLINLVGNAIKFTETGEISLRTQVSYRADTQICLHIAVSDTGIGISQDKQQQIFDAFSQEDTSTTRKYGGTGLGLSISRRLVELMGGNMWLESVPGNGSTFHFTVELAQDFNPPRQFTQPVGLQGRNILIVDDNATNRRVLAGLLAGWDMHTVSAASGQEAICCVETCTQPFDCIILDAHMPEMDGYMLAANLKARWPNLPPMLMLSSGAMRGDALRCQEVGIAGFFSKPISSQELLTALCRVFDLCRDADSIPPKHLVTRHALRELQRSLDILLVEDHVTNQKLALSLLAKWGHRTTLAVNGLEAVNMAAEHRYDLILMDMQMPIMGGIEATRMIRTQESAAGNGHVPIIAMTAAATSDDQAACLEAGMDDYLAKPIKTKLLLEKLLNLGGHDALPETSTSFDYAQALRSADRETVEIIAGVFLATWERDLIRMREGLAQGDLALVERTAHSFRGSLAAFAAEPASQLSGDIETSSRQGNVEGLGGLINLLAEEIHLLAPHLQAVNDRLSG
ncbi:response regulator [Azonexus sp.]|uniref:response regulator n=1 Tax=Azonexus sp. TaxID=1872668 RepID=UPI0027B8CFA0|nr:response regulator [Azonexus sp.]